MASKKIAGDPTSYDRLDDQHFYRDNSHTRHPSASSNIGHFSPSITTSSSSLNQKRDRGYPRPSRIKAMSLVGLKNIFFRQSIALVPTPRTSETQHTDATDVESQDSKSERASQKKGFRVDARVISDATIGLSDGLTVPFALTAGLSALGNTKVVVYGGFAELIAGAISMGLGGYLGAQSET